MILGSLAYSVSAVDFRMEYPRRFAFRIQTRNCIMNLQLINFGRGAIIQTGGNIMKPTAIIAIRLLHFGAIASDPGLNPQTA